MRVLIDARSAAIPERTGVGVYTAALLERLPVVDPHTTYLAWYLHARMLLGEPSPLRHSTGVSRRVLPLPARAFEPLLRRGIPRMEWMVRFDVLFAPNFVPLPTRARPVVLTVHDLGFRRFPDSAPASTRAWLEGFDASLRRAAAILAVSQATKRDLEELFDVGPDRIRVTPLGVDRRVFRRAGDEAVRAVTDRLGVDRPYLLSLGGLEPRKNLPRLVEAWQRLPDDVRPGLVIAGSNVGWSPEGRDLLARALARLPNPLRRRVVVPGYVHGSDRVALLSGAAALAYPSIYEGFGLPVLEAMATGTPVVTSTGSSLPEVAGEAAVLVDPLSSESIADGLERVLRDGALRDRLVQAGFVRAAAYSWDDTARSTAEVFREVAEGRQISRRG